MTIYEVRYEVEEIGDDTELSADLGESLAAWRALRDGAELPQWSVQHLLAFPAKLLALAVFAAYDEAAAAFRIRYWGSHRYDLLGRDYTGCLVAEVGPGCVGEKLRAEYAEVRRARRPLKIHSHFKSRAQGGIRIYDLRLPFATDGATVDGVLTLDDPAQYTRRLFLATEGTPPAWARDDGA